MNKGLHRIIFSKKHSTMVAVAETANSQGKGKQAGSSVSVSPAISAGLCGKLKTTLKTLVCSLVSLSMVLPAHAQITTDKSAPKNQQAVILKTNTGASLVNIQTPNARGLSHNRYTQFDVDNKGAVLNNDRNNNPFLVKGGAQLILNEVRGAASKLNGIVTVGGQKADVIIANPNGITVNGGGFKNVGRGILTTGTPQIGKDGALTGFDVRQGTLTVGAAGWNDKGGADYTEVLARAVALQGKLQGKNLAVSTGPQKVDYASGEISAGTAAGAKPTIALDTAALGGMYADSITLIANEKGVGVKNAGTLEAAKQLIVTSSAQITTDKSAPKNQQAVILKTNTGAPLVNIQTPNARGLSHNRYTQFDVDNKGAVLNNDRNNNPFLVKGGAQLILNEVRGAASKLNGIVTVGGQKADVIIANPNGITVNGGGFKNVGRGILTTGTPQIGKDGALTGFDVRQGTLTVGAAGWNDKGGADYTEVLARAVALQGKLQGKNLAVSTGPQKVDYASGEISAGTAAGAKPTIALDTAALGGMYADSITLIANEKGVGIKNAGTLEAAKQLIVTSSGRIENSGRIATTADGTEASPTYLSIETTEKGAAGTFISNGGRIESKGLLVIETGEDISLRNGAVVQNNGSRPATTVLNAGRNLVIESKTNVNNAKGSANLSAGGRTMINDAAIQAGSSVYSSTKGDTELGGNTRIIAENVTVLSNGSISSAAVIEAKDTAHIEAGKPLSLETSNVASNIRLNNGSIKGGKQVVLMADDDIQAKASHLNASGNLYIHTGKDLNLNADKDLSAQSISLRAGNTALISSNGKTLTAAKNLDVQAGSLSVRQSNLKSSGGNVQMSATKGNISLNQSRLNASQNIDTAALQGNIISDGLTAVAEVGRVSLLANGNVDFNGRNTLTAKGDINAGSVGKGRLKMDNTNINASAGDVKLVAGGQLDLGNGNQRNTVNGGHISLDSSKGSMVVQNVHLNARASLKVDADQTLTINNSKLNSGHNTQINADHGHMTLNQLDAHSRRHMSISAQGKGSGQILQNNQQNSKSTLVADGVLSLNSSALQVLDNTTLRGGAINIKAGGGIIKRGYIDWETQDTATMRSAELKPLAGMMSIESGGDNPLTVEPGNRIVSAGDLAVKHNGKFQISARAGNNGNPSAQTASVLAKGNIGIVAGEVDIDAANIAAGKDLALVATKGNISLNSIRNTFSNYQSETTKQNISQQISVVDGEISKLTSDPKYQEAQNRTEALRREYFKRKLSLRHRDLSDSEKSVLRPDIRASEKSLSSLRAEIKAADEAWAELQSPVKALLERKQSLQQALLTVSQPGRGHENQGSTLSGQNIKLLAAGGIRIQGSKVAAAKQANIQAAGFLPAPAAEERQEGRLQSAIDISGVFDTFEYGQQGSDKYAYAIFSRPSEISGKTGVTLSAPNANENSRISLSAADIEAENGKIKIQSYGDQYYYAGQGELFTFDKHSYKTGKFYNRKHITEIKEHKNAKADPVKLSASQGIEIKSGGSIDVYATQFDAPKGAVHIEAGRKLTLRAVDEINYNKLDSHKKRKFLGITYDKVHDTSTQQMQTALPSRVVAESANLQSGWDTKLQGTQFETTLGGAVIRAGVGDQARADAKIILEGIKSSIHTETVSSSKSALWQKQAGRGSNIETLQLPSFTGPVAPVLSAPGGYIVDIPKGNLKTEIEKLAKQPEYAYLKQLQVAKNVNWNQVQLAYDKWDYKQEGLTGAGAAIIALAVTVVTSGAGTGAALGLNGAAAAATDAAFASLASQASVSLINNKGDVGKTLKELGRSSTVKNLVVAAATAGVADKIGASALNNVSDKQWVNNLTVNLANAGSASLINTAVNGGSLKDNLEANILAALVNTAHGEAASKIKQLDQHYIAHKIAHAVAGCAAAAANKGKCQDGAIGAAVGEILGEALLSDADLGRLNPTERAKIEAKIIAKAKLVAGTVAALSKGDVNTAANAAAVAVENNSLNDIQDRLLSGDYALCMSAGGAESFCESYRPLGLPHFVSVSGEMKLPNKFGNRMVNGKLIINTRNGNVYFSVGKTWSTVKSTKSNISGVSVGWVLNVSPNDYLKGASMNDFRSSAQNKAYAEMISQTLVGESVGGSICLTKACFSVSSTVSKSKSPFKDSKIIGEIGLGSGVAAGVEETIYIGNIKDIDKFISANMKK